MSKKRKRRGRENLVDFVERIDPFAVPEFFGHEALRKEAEVGGSYLRELRAVERRRKFRIVGNV